MKRRREMTEAEGIQYLKKNYGETYFKNYNDLMMEFRYLAWKRICPTMFIIEEETEEE